MKRGGRTARSSGGAALIVVLLALALLFSLGVPFLLAGRLRSDAAQGGFDRARARLAVESASGYALYYQAASHPSLDSTPFYDSAAEWDPASAGAAPASLGEEWRGFGEAWGYEVENQQARVSLASASPMALQNLIRPCFVSEDADFRATELAVTSTEGFPDAGLVFLNNQWIQYGARTPSSFLEVVPESEPPEDLQRTRFRAGDLVLDPRVLSLVLARLQRGRQAPPEFYNDLFLFTELVPDPLPEAERELLRRRTWLATGAYGAAAWGPATWLTQPIDRENPATCRVADAAAFGPGGIARFDVAGSDPLDLLVLASYPDQGLLLFLAPLPAELPPLATRVYPLLREPVDLNSAAPEIVEALATGVRWGQTPPLPFDEEVQPPTGNPQRDWITPRKAKEFAARVVQARPLVGPDDLWERVLRPMAASGLLSDFEAWALHQNGLDPSDGSLAQSTMPFGYRSGDRYLQRVNAAVRSRLGTTLARASWFEEVQAAPEGPALHFWSSQFGFDELGRYGRGLHGVTSLPNNLGMLAGHGDLRSALSLRCGVYPPTGVVKPEQRDEDSAVMPLPARDSDGFGPNTRGRTRHFDFEPSPLGYDVRIKGPLDLPLEDWGLAAAQQPISAIEPLHLQGWFELPATLGDSFLFDLSGPTADRQRVYAALERGQLMVYGYDNAGEDLQDPDGLTEAVKVRIDPAEYPLAERWMHLSVLLRGVAPRGLQVAVDGVPRGESNVLTYTTAAVSGFAAGSTDDEIPVESTEGFPDRGVIRIGDEVLEYSSKTAGSFVTQRVAGADGYFGGRVAREASDTLINSQDSIHPQGAAVELYGYSALLSSPIPPGGGRLSGGVGPFSVATAVMGGDTISVLTLFGTSIEVGQGIKGGYVGALELAEAFAGDPYYAEAFQSDGGYALLFQPNTGWEDVDGFPVGGFEIVHYSSRAGTTLQIDQRNVRSPGVVNAANIPYGNSGHSYVTEWHPSIVDNSGQPLLGQPEWRVFIMPISIKGSGVSDAAYLPPVPGPEGRSEFVQIYTPGDSGLTEWVRYDSVLNGHFLRDDERAILDAVGTYVFNANLPPPGPPPGGGGGGGGGGVGTIPRGPGGGMRPPWQEPENDYQFVRTLGEPVAGRDVEIERIRRAFDFRGVLHTHDHAQSANARLIPVFRTNRPNNTGPWNGFAGRLDRVAVMQPGSTLPPFWYTVEWGTAPQDRGRVLQGHTYVAFREDPGVPFLGGDLENVAFDDPAFDGRFLPRLVKFPSGERPIELDAFVVGGDSTGSGAPFPGYVDEVSLHTVSGLGNPLFSQARGALVLEEDLDSSSTGQLKLDLYALTADGQRRWAANAGQFLDLLPDGGLLDIDGERVAFSEVDSATGEITIAPNGRGLHGTEPRGHAAGAPVWIVDGRAATVLSGDVSAEEAFLAVDSNDGFAPRPLLLVGEELIHSPLRGLSGELAMPRRRPSQGDRGTNRAGDEGLLRGRFGTRPASHDAGTLVYSFPVRWEDRYIPQSDSPAGAWYQVGLEEPEALWRGLRWAAELPDASQRVRVLARAGTASWEDPPGVTPGLVLVEESGAPGAATLPLDLRSDRLELRVSFDWDAGAFDPVDFLATGWTTAPRLRSLLVDYLAEARVARAAEIVE